MKKIHLLGRSQLSWEDAARQAVANLTVRPAGPIPVTHFELVMGSDGISQYGVRIDLPDVADTLTGPARILVADDLEPITTLVRLMLEKAGYRVDTVADGSEALAAVRANRYDLVLMDINMPNMDGIAATRAIRALDPPTCTVPIVAMTTNVLPEHIRQYKAAGMDDCVGKPLKREFLLHKLSELLPAASDGPPADVLEPPAPSFDQFALDEIRETMGAEQVNMWLRKFLLQLEATFPLRTAGPDRERLGKDAHQMVAHSALLGFPALSQMCSDLEVACSDGRQFAVPLHLAATAARAAEGRVREILRAEPTGP